MDASQYKDYVLFMLFIKYITDKYGSSSDFAPPVTIPHGASFKDMVALKGKSDIGDKINTQIIQPLIDANARLARSDFPDFNDPNRLGEGQAMVDRLTNLIGIFQKPELRKRWATMEELMSAGERKQRIIADIIEDFSLKPRLNNDRGTAILVAPSIYDACHYFRLFQNTSFGPYCGIITSYEPNHNAISREPSNSDERYKFDTYTKHVLKPGQSTKQYEDEAKRRFIDEPANMKLLIVVSKLLTGFDAPSCTYIYLDNELRDHNLFQAICRTSPLAQ